MTNKERSDLINDFFEGLTSEKEERMLYEYFTKNTIPENQIKDRDAFMYLYQHVNNIEIPNNLEENVNNLIDKLEKIEKKKRNWVYIGSIAASLAIIVSITTFIISDNKIEQNTPYADTFSDPNEAYQITEKALILASLKLNKGLEQVGSVQKELDKTNEIIQKNILR